MKTLKALGLHHGLSLVAISWMMCFLVHPLAGIITSIYLSGYFVGREIDQSQHRKWSNNPVTIAKSIEWLDWVTPKIFAIINIWLMWGMPQMQEMLRV